MTITVLDSATLGEDISLEPISSLGEAIIYSASRPDEVAARLETSEIAVINKAKMTAGVLSSAKKLRLICVTATGYDNIDTDYCRAHGIAVCNVAGYSTDSVAQVTVAMALSLATHLGEYERSVEDGTYTRSKIPNRLQPVYHELSSMTWGVVGLGAIGRKVATIASSFGCRVIANRRSGADNEYECVPLDTLLCEADIVSLHTPLTDETRKMIDSRRLALMKPTALLINAARGAVCDEAAVASAIENGIIGGFGCDVYTAEPIAEDNPLMRVVTRPNVILTPHMAWGAYEARKRCVDEVAENIKSFLSGGNRSRIV